MLYLLMETLGEIPPPETEGVGFKKSEKIGDDSWLEDDGRSCVFLYADKTYKVALNKEGEPYLCNTMVGSDAANVNPQKDNFLKSLIEKAGIVLQEEQARLKKTTVPPKMRLPSRAQIKRESAAMQRHMHVWVNHEGDVVPYPPEHEE